MDIVKKLLENDPTRCYDCGGRISIATQNGKQGILCPRCGFEPYADGPNPGGDSFRDGHYNGGNWDAPPPAPGPSYPRQDESIIEAYGDDNEGWENTRAKNATVDAAKAMLNVLKDDSELDMRQKDKLQSLTANDNMYHWSDTSATKALAAIKALEDGYRTWNRVRMAFLTSGF